MNMREKNKPKITVNEKVLLYLREFSKLKDFTVSPFEITQPGIADSIGIRVNHVPRAIKHLKRLGYVEDLITHVRGSTKKRKVHYLTEEGMTQADSLKKKFENLHITLITPDKAPVEVKISEVNSVLSENLRFFDVINNVSADGVFDFTRFERTPRTKIAKKKRIIAEYLGKIPETDQFFNREKEISNLKRWLGADSYGLIIIEGSPGMGKSALISKSISEDFSDKDVFWYSISESADIRGIMESMSDFLHQIGRDSLKVFVDSRGTSDSNKCASMAVQDLIETNVILVFDGFDDVPEELKDLVFMIFRSLDSELHSNVKIVITTRMFERLYEKNKDLSEASLFKMKISGLDEKTARKFENLEELSDAEFKRIYQLTEGNPRLLLRITSQLEEDKDKEYTPDELTMMRYLGTFKKE
jgi:hypothetical protein